MKRALKKSERGNSARPSIAVEIEEEDYLSTFMWYGGMDGFVDKYMHMLEISKVLSRERFKHWANLQFNVIFKANTM